MNGSFRIYLFYLQFSIYSIALLISFILIIFLSLYVSDLYTVYCIFVYIFLFSFYLAKEVASEFDPHGRFVVVVVVVAVVDLDDIP